MKYIIVSTILIMLCTLGGCATTPRIITTVSKPIGVPILYCPAPPTLVRPALPISQVTKTTNEGQLVKMYVATIETIIGYSNQQQLIINQYKKDNIAYTVLAKKIAAQWKAKTGETLKLPHISQKQQQLMSKKPK
jgi:hypothetical protein